MDKTLADIRDQAATVTRTVATLADLEVPEWLGTGGNRVVYTGSGSSYYVGGIGAELAAMIAGTDAHALPASDIWLLPGHHLRSGDALIGISRTGTTFEGVRALHRARSLGVRTVAISLGTGTPLQDESDWSIALPHVEERGRVMMQSVSNLMAATTWLAARMAMSATRPEGILYAEGLVRLGSILSATLSDFEASAVAVAARDFDHHVILASGPFVPLAHEIALKFNEMTQIPVESYSLMEYRHGPIAALSSGTLVSILGTRRSLPFIRLVVDDVAQLGGTSLVATTAESVEATQADIAVSLSPDLPEWMAGSLALPFFQFLIYYQTLRLGKDPDRVRNLDADNPPSINPHFPDIDLPAQ